MNNTRSRADGRGRWLWLAAGLVAAAVIGWVLVSVGNEPSNAEVAAADAALAVPIVRFDGTEDSLESYAGQHMVVNFFASWCAPCLAELPEFEQVHQDLAGEVTFVGLNIQDPPEAGLAVIDQTGITFEVARDPNGEVFTAFGAMGMPTTVFIDDDGRVVEVFSGVLPGEALLERIEEFLL